MKRKKSNPSDAGLFRKSKVKANPRRDVPSIKWDPATGDPSDLARFLIENTPSLAAYRHALDNAREQPECPDRNAALQAAHKALRGDTVASAINTALADAGFHWGEGNGSPRRSFVAGFKLAEALHLWAVGDELLRKKNVLSGKAIASRPRPGRAVKNSLRNLVVSTAWPEYQEEVGAKATKSGFLVWLRKTGAEEYRISYDPTDGTFEHGGFIAAWDTVRRWLK